MSSPLYLAQITDLSREAHLPKLARWAMVFAVYVTKWDANYRSRRQLGRLEPHMLDDIGRSKTQAIREAQKPFWER